MMAIPAPEWLSAWPVGLRPSRLSAVEGGMRLLFDRGDGPTIEVSVSADAALPTKVVRPASLGKVERALLLAVRDLIDDRVYEHARRCAALVAWRREARAKSDGHRDRQLEAALQVLEGASFEAEQPEDAAVQEAARVLVDWHRAGAAAASVLRLAIGDIGGAIDAHDRAQHYDSACSVVIDGFAGLAVGVRAKAKALAHGAMGLEQQRALTRLLTVVEEESEALELRHSVAVRTASAADWREVGRLAALCRRPDVARAAYEGVVAAATEDADLPSVIDSLFEAGDPEGALECAREVWLSRGLLDVALRLAELELYKGNAARSLELSERVLSERAGDLRARRVRGAANAFAGNAKAALSDLDYVLERQPKDSEALLWRAAARRDSGDTGGMFDDLKPGGRFADHPVWQLQRKQADLAYRSDHNEEPWSKSPSHLSLLVQMHGRDAVRPIVDDDGRLGALVDATMVQFAGNRSRWPTRVRDGRLEALYDLEAPRSQAVNAQARIVCRTPEAVLEELAGLADEDEFSPFARTYASEIHLWRGDYELAQAGFDRIWESTKTRWGYVGGGAARMLLGKYDEALAVWENGKTEYDYLPEEATYAYRGELHWRRGDLDLARADLLHATRENPARMGAWVALGLVELDAGDPDAGVDAIETIERTLPILLWEGRRRAGVAQRGPLDAAARRAMLASCLEMLGGNRASSLYAFTDADGRFRVLGTAQLRIWRDIAQHARVFARDAVIGRLLATRDP